MVTYQSYLQNSWYRVNLGEGFDGVVKITNGTHYASGVLLYDGRSVLTAAHLFSQGVSEPKVKFQTISGDKTISVSQVLIHPNFDGSKNDLALLWLSEPAPLKANRSELYRKGDELDKVFTVVGYGLTGDGWNGVDESNPSNGLKLKAQNRFEATEEDFKKVFGYSLEWATYSGSTLVADFDSGSSLNDALGYLLNRPDTGLGVYEGLIARGDSGSPAFIDGKVAGISTLITRLDYNGRNTDVDDKVNSSFGELGVWQRASYFQKWIDQSLRDWHEKCGAPTKPEEVKKQVLEGDSGTSLVYFLVRYLGTRSDPNEVVSVEYRTVDGTAKAGSDYLPVSGQLNLYPNENYAVIPVEIIGDTIPEEDEYFSLEIFNPVGGSFEGGVVKLTASRLIVDDDWLV